MNSSSGEQLWVADFWLSNVYDFDAWVLRMKTGDFADIVSIVLAAPNMQVKNPRVLLVEIKVFKFNDWYVVKCFQLDDRKAVLTVQCQILSKGIKLHIGDA